MKSIQETGYTRKAFQDGVLNKALCSPWGTLCSATIGERRSQPQTAPAGKFDSPLEFLRFKQRCDLKNKIRFKSETLMRREKMSFIEFTHFAKWKTLHLFVRESGEPEAISVHQRCSGSQVSQEWEWQSSESTAPCPVQGICGIPLSPLLIQETSVEHQKVVGWKRSKAKFFSLHQLTRRQSVLKRIF